jgi:hypothetical protein
LRCAVQRRTGCAAHRFAAFVPLFSLVSSAWLAPASPAFAQTAQTAPEPSPPPGTPGAGSSSASAPPEGANAAEIVAARELFREGAEDADAGRFTEGLEKFKRVAAVKETAAVRFNIARCEESLGKTGAALADFELAAREGGQDAKAADVAKLAVQRADALRPRVPRLTVVPPPHAPDKMSVSLDGGKLASATLGVGLPIDPGAHEVDATAPGRKPFHAALTLVAGQTARVELVLPTSGDPLTTSTTAASTEGDPSPSAKEAASPSKHSYQAAAGWVTIVVGALLGAGSGLFLVLHDNDVDTLKTACPTTTNCPVTPSQYANLNGVESNARLYDGLSVAFLAGGALALGTGVVLVATAPNGKTPAVSMTAGAPSALAGLSLKLSF